MSWSASPAEVAESCLSHQLEAMENYNTTNNNNIMNVINGGLLLWQIGEEVS